jgi:CHAD domain-containing protein
MAMKSDRSLKPLRSLAKVLRRLREDPSPRAVHKLRVQVRQLEAIATALGGYNKHVLRLLQSIKSIRKAAGSVRDMDVLADRALSLPGELHPASLTRLMKFLGSAREKDADHLLHAIGKRKKEIRKNLQLLSDLIRPASPRASISLDAEASALRAVNIARAPEVLINELSLWPTLNEGNLHGFRIKLKALSAVAKLFGSAPPEFLRAIGKLNKMLGVWHDWRRLRQIAAETLDPALDRELLAQITRAHRMKLRLALAEANAFREEWLQQAGRLLPNQREKLRPGLLLLKTAHHGAGHRG